MENSRQDVRLNNSGSKRVGLLAAALGALSAGASICSGTELPQGATEANWPTKEWQTSFPNLDVVAVTMGRDLYSLSEFADQIFRSVKSDTALPVDATGAKLLADKIHGVSTEKRTEVGPTSKMTASISGKVCRFPPNGINVKSLTWQDARTFIIDRLVLGRGIPPERWTLTFDDEKVNVRFKFGAGPEISVDGQAPR